MKDVLGIATALRLAAITAIVAAPTALRADDSFDSLRLERRHRSESFVTARRHSDVRERRQARHVTTRTEVRSEENIYSVVAGQELRATLEGWCEKHGWKLDWQSDFAYTLSGSARFSGSFEEAVRALFASMTDVRPMPTAKLYDLNKMMVVRNQGSTLTD